MKKRINFFVILLVISTNLFAQSVDELEKRNGFKDIQLASDVSLYQGLIFEEEIDDEKFGKLQVYGRAKDQYQSIGTIPIQNLKVRVYNGEVYEIQVIIFKDPKMYGGLKQAFGPPKFDIVTNYYHWQSPSVKLIYRSFDKKQLELIYHSKVIDRKLEQEKGEEIDAIANDF